MDVGGSWGTGTSVCPSLSLDEHRSRRCHGVSLVELTLVLAILMCLIGIGVPTFAQSADAKRTRDAANYLAGQFRLARQRAVLTGRHVAVVFEDVAGHVEWRLCTDEDRDGMSRADVTSGVDRCEDPAQSLALSFPEVAVGYLTGVPSPDGEIDAVPVRLGPARMAVFTPIGTASSGTVAVSGPGGNQFAVRVSGMTGRTRTLRFDSGRRLWTE